VQEDRSELVAEPEIAPPADSEGLDDAQQEGAGVGLVAEAVVGHREE
jgi:hypothetical protein